VRSREAVQSAVQMRSRKGPDRESQKERERNAPRERERESPERGTV